MAETTATTSLASPPDGGLSGTSLPSFSAAASSIEVKKRGGVVSSSPPDDPIVDSQIAFDTPKSNPGLGGSSVAGSRSLGSRSVDSYNRGGGGNTNKKKGRDPPEIEWPTNKNSDETTHDKKSPTKSTTSFYVPNPRRNPTLSKSSSSSFHGRNNSSNGSSSSSFNSSMSSIQQRARGISGESEKRGGGRDTPDVLSTSYKTKSSLSGDALNLSYRSKSSSSDEDHVVFMDPIESDEEPEQKEGSDSDEEATLTDHPDEDEASPHLRSRPTFPIVLMKNNYPRTAPAPLRNDSHIQQGRSSKDQQHLSNWKCPTSAPQHRLSNQQAMHTGGHSSTGRISRSFGRGNPGPGPASGEGMGGVMSLPFYHLSGRQNSNNLKPSQRIQSLPRRNTIQSQSQSQQQHYQKHVPSSRRVSEAAIQYLYTDGIDLLKKAAIEANAPEDVESLNDSINFLRSSLESTVLEEGGYQEEECFKSIPSLQPKFDVTPNEQHFNQISASVSLPPSRPSPAENQRVKRSNSHGSSKANGSHTIHQQQQVGYPTSQTRRPPITAAAGMEYIMNASRAHTQSDNSDTSNEHDKDDDDEIVDVSSKNHDIFDVGKMQYFLNAITRGVDTEEGAKNDTHPSSRGKNTRRTSLEGYDDNIDRKLSMHTEVKNDISPGHHSKSLPHVQSRHLIERQCSSSAPSVSSVIPPSSDDNFAAEAEDCYNDDVCDRQISSRALGPRSQRPGGTTGIVLESSGSLSSSDGDHTTRSKFNRQISDPIVMSPDKESRGWSEKSLGGDFIDAESTLMMKLCSHLLPSVLNNDHMIDNSLSDQLVLNKINLVWDNDDPDEPGYIVHRLTESELASIEIAFEKYVALSAQMSEKHMSIMSNDSNFERDLEEVEGILSKLSMPKKKASESTNNDDSDLQVKENGAIRDSVPNFPGIYPSGKGIVGELECFYLPIITKSQNTGFEPTKDIVLKPGSIFAKNYLVQSELGSAAFSTAYQCLDLSSEEDEDGYRDEVCLKVIKNTKDYFDQSLDEIKILQLLKDTGKTEENHVVEMKSFFYHREHLVIVTELLRQNLYEFGKIIIESRGNVYFTRPRLSHIIRQCLVALKFVHELGLVHSDIKPENILLSSYSRALIKIIDFGSSSFVSDRQSSYIQSRSYRAPEVILGLPYDGKIDIWSLGCVVAELYTNEVTFQNDSELSMLSRLEAICGPFPRHMIDKGRNCHRIFTDSGLIYKKISSSDDDDVDKDSSHESSSIDNSEKFFFRVYQPKTTTVAARLGFDEDLLDQPHLSDNDKNRALFTDFVRKLLMIDPDKRPTAAEALDHPWIKSSLDLTEEDILYYQGS